MQYNIYKLYLIKASKWFMLTMPILMLFYQDLGFTNEESFRLKAFYALSIVILEIPSGYAADVWGRKTTLIIGAICGFLGFLIYAFSHSYWYFLAAEVTLGIGQSFISGSDSAMLYDTLVAMNRKSDYMKLEGRIFSLGNYAEAMAGLAGGALAEISLRLPFQFQTGIAFIAIPAAISLIEPQAYKSRIKPGITDILQVIHFALVKNEKLRWNLIYSSIMGTATLSMAWIYQRYLKESANFSSFQIGTIATILNIVVGTTTLYAYKIEKKLRPKLTVWLITLLITNIFIIMGFFPSILAVGFLIAFYISRGIATPILKDYVNRITTSDIRATVLSLRSLLIRGLFAIIAPLFGWLVDIYHWQQAFLVLGLTFLILTGSSIFMFLRSIEKDN